MPIDRDSNGKRAPRPRSRTPNIVQVYDYGEDEGRPYMALEYLPGGTLGERIPEGRALDDEETRRVATDIAAGLAHAHESGVVHRDLKPGNVLFDAEQLAQMHRDVEAPPLTRFRPDAPEDLATLAMSSLAKDPAARPQDGAALLAALEGSAPAPTLVSDAATVRLPTQRRRRRAPLAVAAVALLLLLAALLTGGHRSIPLVLTGRPDARSRASIQRTQSTAATTAPTTTRQTTTQQTQPAPTTTSRPPTTAPTPSTTAPTTTVITTPTT